MCFDSNDNEMFNIILSCIEEACTIQSQNVFLLILLLTKPQCLPQILLI